MAPSGRADVVIQLLVALACIARLLLFGDRPVGSEFCSDRVEVFPGGVAVPSKYLKSMRGLTRIGPARPRPPGSPHGL